MRIRTRLICNYIAIVIVILPAISVYLNYALRQMLDRRITDELRVQANLTRELLIKTLPEILDYNTVDGLLDKLGEATAARLTFIGVDGIVWGDTERDGLSLREMDNHLKRPEVQLALSHGSGVADRYSTTIDTSLRYYALPVFRQTENIGICRVALPMRDVNAAIARFTHVVVLTSGAGIIAVILLSIVTAGRTVKPIQELVQTAKAISEGDVTARVGTSTSSELAQLYRHFNHMANRVETQINEISQDRNRLDAILSNMIEGVLLIGPAFEITYANPAAAELLDLPADSEGRNLVEAFRNPDLQRLLEQVRDTKSHTMGEIRWIAGIESHETEITVAPITDLTSLEILGYVVVLHDVSQLRRLERIRSDFVANVSHELRTPLTSIQGYVETLLNEDIKDSATSQRFLAKILQQSSQISRLISDLLDLSRLESGAVQLKLEQCVLKDFQFTLLDIFEPAFEESKLKFNCNIPDDLPTVLADKRLLEQVLINLIDNAIKYTPTGGCINVSAEASASEALMHVTDTGIGIPSDALPRIFERFYRVDKGRSREMEGTGLGLSIAKHILLQHHGRIWAESVLGEGTVFHFALPLQNGQFTAMD